MWRFLIGLCLLSCNVVAAEPDNNQHVILISVDGLRYDYIEKHGASHLAAIAERGVRAERMIPVYPANTFPNHLSLITGRYPVNHGIVNNRFAEKQRSSDNHYARYSMGKGYQDATWLQGVPLWNLAELNGVTAATYFWPESDARINGRTPTYFYRYSKPADYQRRIDQIIQWLSLGPETRPRFIAGYFSLVDTKGHDFGPDSAQTQAAVQTVDELLGQLYERIQQFDFPVNLVIVSDHGMQQKDTAKQVDVASLNIDDSQFEMVNQHTQLHIYARQQTTADAVQKLTGELHEHAGQRYTVMNEPLRQKYHYPVTSRTGDILLQVATGGEFVDGAAGHTTGGSHGYWPQETTMGATFVAAGPAFKAGVTLAPMSNLEVYPVIADIMGLPLIGDIDGKIDILEAGLKRE